MQENGESAVGYSFCRRAGDGHTHGSRSDVGPDSAGTSGPHASEILSAE